jgi:trimethylamine corrinoid protein
MTKKIEIKEILDVLLDFKGEKIKDYCLEKLSDGIDPYDIFNELSLGLGEIGKGFESKKFQRYFTSDLIISGRNMRKAVEMLRRRFKRTLKTKGTVIVGTVKGDVHDIGKMIFAIMLESNGFKVIDLGVDVSKESFIEKIEETAPDILGMSALLTSTISNMGDVVEELKKENLREKIKIIVGGKAVTKNFAREIGVDAYGKDCIDGLRKCLSFIEAQK